MPILGIIDAQKISHLTAITGAFDALATVTAPSGGVSSIVFAGIPQGYKHLQIRGLSRASSGNAYMKLRFNGDSAGNYTYHEIYGSGTAIGAEPGTSQTGACAVTVAAGSLASGIFAPAIIDIIDYSSSSKNKVAKSLDGFESTTTSQVVYSSGLWLNTAAINSIELVLSASTFAQNSTFALYGIK